MLSAYRALQQQEMWFHVIESPSTIDPNAVISMRTNEMSMIHNFILPIFQDMYHVDEIEAPYDDHVKKEKHIINDFELTTQLTLYVNLTSHLDFKCEFSITDVGFCSDSLLIHFVGMLVLMSTMEAVKDNNYMQNIGGKN